MLIKFKKLTIEQYFIIIAFILSILVSFLFGYLVFRYWAIDVCKSEMKVIRQDVNLNLD